MGISSDLASTFTLYCVFAVAVLGSPTPQEDDLESPSMLKCYCDETAMGCQNGVCETDGFCFAFGSLEDGVEKYGYQLVLASCMEFKALIPFEHPWSCSTRKSNTSAVECCNSGDMCNRGLRPQLLPKTMELPTTTVETSVMPETDIQKHGSDPANIQSSEKLTVETSGSSSVQETHFALSLVPLLRAQPLSTRLDMEAHILKYFKQRVDNAREIKQITP